MMYNFTSHGLGWAPWMVGIGGLGLILMLVLALAVIALKGYALWHAARRSEKGWFIALLIVNTFGILELAYLYFVVGKWHTFKDNGTPPTTPA